LGFSFKKGTLKKNSLSLLHIEKQVYYGTTLCADMVG
jgi:hypothetical protein